MFVYRLEDCHGNGPYSDVSWYTNADVRTMLIHHLIPEDQVDTVTFDEVVSPLLYDKKYYFAWSTAELICAYVEPQYHNLVKETGFAITVYNVPDEHCYILPKDGQVIFDRNHQREVLRIDYMLFLSLTEIEREELLK